MYQGCTLRLSRGLEQDSADFRITTPAWPNGLSPPLELPIVLESLTSQRMIPKSDFFVCLFVINLFSRKRGKICMMWLYVWPECNGALMTLVVRRWYFLIFFCKRCVIRPFVNSIKVSACLHIRTRWYPSHFHQGSMITCVTSFPLQLELGYSV